MRGVYLDPEDPHARAALMLYADAIKTDRPERAAEIRKCVEEAQRDAERQWSAAYRYGEWPMTSMQEGFRKMVESAGLAAMRFRLMTDLMDEEQPSYDDRLDNEYDAELLRQMEE